MLSIMKALAHDWLRPEGVTSEVLLDLTLKVGPLPSAYLELLSHGNGGEVALKVNPFNFCLDPVETALDYWKSGTYTITNIFVFGGDGGSSLLAFDLSSPGKWPVVCFDPIDPAGSMKTIASDFESLLELVGHNG
jgi:hypothetical protein